MFLSLYSCQWILQVTNIQFKCYELFYEYIFIIYIYIKNPFEWKKSQLNNFFCKCMHTHLDNKLSKYLNSKLTRHFCFVPICLDSLFWGESKQKNIKHNIVLFSWKKKLNINKFLHFLLLLLLKSFFFFIDQLKNSYSY